MKVAVVEWEPRWFVNHTKYTKRASFSSIRSEERIGKWCNSSYLMGIFLQKRNDAAIILIPRFIVAFQ